MVVSHFGEDFTGKYGKIHHMWESVVTKVYKTPDTSIVTGENFKVFAEKSVCPCFKQLNSGMYIFTGQVNSVGNLVISGNVLKITSL